jgi:protein translocase SEC61 complex gamma subunit
MMVLSLLSDLFKRVKETLESYKRVLIACKKPDLEEYKSYLKECLIGTLIIGLIGFLFYLIFSILRI